MSEHRTIPHGWPVHAGAEVCAGDDQAPSRDTEAPIIRVSLVNPENDPNVAVFVGWCYDEEGGWVEFTDPAELRALARRVGEAADILEAVQSGEYTPPAPTTRPVTVSESPGPLRMMSAFQRVVNARIAHLGPGAHEEARKFRYIPRA